MSRRLAVATVFFANGAGLASWVPHIPAVQAALAIGPAALGLALLAMPAGAMAGITLAGWLIPRAGSRRVLSAGAAVFFPALALPLLAPSVPLLAIALLVLGASNGAMDVSMNAQAAAEEARSHRAIMSSLHGCWSVGGLVGAAAAAGALALGAAPEAHVVVATAGLGLAAVVALGRLPAGDVPVGCQGRQRVRATGLLAGLGMIAFLALLAEGAIGDWSAVYLRHSLATSPAVAACGFAAFSFAMAAGRLAGDRLVAHFGGVALVRASAILAAAGLAAALLLGHPGAALAGFACVGLGIANLIPVTFRAAAQLPGLPSGHGLAAVTAVGYTGFLAGPPAIGLVAEAATLRGALVVVVLALVVIAARAGAAALGADSAHPLAR